MEAPPVEARPAATVMLIRDSGEGIQVLMVRRPPRGFFGGLTVFPGGAVEPADASALAEAVISGDHSDRELRAAALRELAEETGLALTSDGVIAAPSLRGAALLTDLRDRGIQLDASALSLVSRWVTPETAPTRFDTTFYLAGVGQTPEIRLDTDELVDHMWITPRTALDLHSSNQLEMFLPTVAHLRWLDMRGSVEEAVAAARGADGTAVIAPRTMDDGSLVPIPLSTEL